MTVKCIKNCNNCVPEKSKPKKVDEVDNLRVAINHSTITATAESLDCPHVRHQYILPASQRLTATHLFLFIHLKWWQSYFMHNYPITLPALELGGGDVLRHRRQPCLLMRRRALNGACSVPASAVTHRGNFPLFLVRARLTLLEIWRSSP